MSQADIAVSRKLQQIAKELDKELAKAANGQRMGFSLIVFSDSTAGQTNYVSNCSRPEAALALQKVLDRWQSKGVIDVPAHKKH
ncbi:hypothetical protein GCM10011369_23090 [Neiella marina]|uniref:Uncharacterized protein n=1 Tax=Neiella marina TaxID=508461 RepID=A0A8J2U646_9GAMM|nr:hypothetical protein [Neiella marina]GGA80541.1 hypothetical protein GCM10011369_23090 [Neiella marina]